MFRAMGRPVLFNALLMSGYVLAGSIPLVLHQSILTQSTPHSAYELASSCQWSLEPGRPPTHVCGGENGVKSEEVVKETAGRGKAACMA